MTTYADAFRRCLAEADVAGVMKLWKHVMPNMPQPANEEQGLIQLHLARTIAKSMPFKLRAYSHSWLCERGYPSQLPDVLKPRAERLYPKKVTGVGISVNIRSPLFKPAATMIERVMSDAVLDAYADGREDPEFVKARMAEARQRESKKLQLPLD